MPTWPASLPQFLLVDGFEIEFAENRLRSDNDAGPAKVRRRTTLNVGIMRGSMVMDCAQKATFQTFVNDTLLGGTIAFDFPALEGGTQLVRFGPQLPVLKPVSPQLFSFSFELEILP